MRPVDMGLALAVMLMWGLNFVVAKVGMYHTPPIFFVALRFAAVALILVPFVKVPYGKLRQIGVLSFVLGSLHFTLMYTAMRMIDAGTASVVIQLQVPFAAILAALVFKDRLGWRNLAGMAVAFAGVVLIAGAPRLAGNQLPILLIVAAAFFFAIVNILIKRLGSVDGNSLNAWTALFAAPQTLLLSLLLENGQWQSIEQMSWLTVGSLVYQVVILVIVAYWLWYRLLHRYPVAQVVPFMLLLPIVGVLSGALLLNEPLGWDKLVGGMLTLSGVSVLVLRRPPAAAASGTSTT